MLVVDVDPLTAVDVLNLPHQITLHFLFAGDAKNVMRHEGAVDQRFARLDDVAGVNAEMFAMCDKMLALNTAFILHHDGSLAAALLSEQFHLAVDLGHDGRILRLAGLKDFGHARQTTGDVLRARSFTGRLGKHVSGGNLLARRDFDVGLFWQVVEVEDLAVLVFQHDLRMIDTLVLHHHAPHVSAGVLLEAERLVLDDILITHLARHFRQNGDRVRVPLHEHHSWLYLVIVGHLEDRTGWNFELFQFAPLRIDDGDFSISCEHDLLALLVLHRAKAGEFHGACPLGTALALLDSTLTDATDVERTHRQLRARFTDALSCDDADSHALLDHGAGGEVHAVAKSAHTQRGLARQCAANLDLFEPQFLDLPGHLPRDQFVLVYDHFVGDRIHDVGTADAASDAVGETHLDLLPAVDDRLVDALRGAAVLHRHDDVLRHVGEFAGEIARVGRLESRVGQTLTGTVRGTEVFEHGQAFTEIGLDRRLDDLA